MQTKDYEPSVLREVIEAQEQAHLPSWSRPLTDLLKKWVVTGTVDAKATCLSMDAACAAAEALDGPDDRKKASRPRRYRAALWAGALESVFNHAEDATRGAGELDLLAQVLREQFHLQLSIGAEQESAWAAALAKCSELKANAELSEVRLGFGEAQRPTTELFGSLDSEQKKRKKKSVDKKKKKTIAAYEAKSLVQQVINETCNSEESDVVSVPASPTAAAEVDRMLSLQTAKPKDGPRECSTTDPSSSCTSSTEDGTDRKSARKVVYVVNVDPLVEEWRNQFYAALKQQNASSALESFLAHFKETLEQQPTNGSAEWILLRSHAEIALLCLRNAEWCRHQLWKAYSSGHPTCIDELLQQAEICLHGFPSMVAKSWCPRTGADVLGYVAQSVPAKLLGSLVRIVQGRPDFLRDVREKRNAEHVSSGDDDVSQGMI
jgi:hypothetical protein